MSETTERVQKWINGLTAIMTNETIDTHVKSLLLPIFEDIDLYLKEIQPPEPKTLENALHYAERGKEPRTYVALLTADGHLIRTIKVANKAVKKIPVINFTEEVANVAMKQYIMNIPTLNFKKAVPKKITTGTYQVLVYDGKTVKQLSA